MTLYVVQMACSDGSMPCLQGPSLLAGIHDHEGSPNKSKKQNGLHGGEG